MAHKITKVLPESYFLKLLDTGSPRQKKWAAGELKANYGYDDDRSERDYGDPESLGARHLS